MEHPAILWTSNGWIAGNLHLPLEADSTCAGLEQEGLPNLTDVSLEETCNEFSAAFRMPTSRSGSRWWVTIHQRLSVGNRCGELKLPKNLRFADCLKRENHWLAMRDCWVQTSFLSDPSLDEADRLVRNRGPQHRSPYHRRRSDFRSKKWGIRPVFQALWVPVPLSTWSAKRNKAASFRSGCVCCV